jgi:heme iron utilization protein
MTSTAEAPKAAAGPSNSPADEARMLVRRALKSALGTLARGIGDPYVSLVTVATAMNGAPLLLISKLALHTQNISANPRASLLIDGTDGAGDPLAGGRVTLIGQLTRTDSTEDRRRFLARQPAARMYADFPDFAFYRLDIERAHFIGGFGRIVDLEPAQLLLDVCDAEALAAAEPDIVSHMNVDHADALELYATRLAKSEPGRWQMAGIDPEGLDLVCGSKTARVLFTVKVLSANDARAEFVRMAASARAMKAQAIALPKV